MYHRIQPLKSCARILFAAWLALFSAWATAAEATPLVIRPVQVARDVFYVQGMAALGSSANRNFVSNAGFVITPESVVVIDALGSPDVARTLIAEIRSLTDRPISHVIVTHYHADHIYGLQAFKDIGARILAHPAAREYLQSDAARLRLQASRVDMAPWIDEQTRIVEPDQWVAAPISLFSGGLEIRLLPAGPAHTPEDLMVVIPSRGVVFSGDLAFLGRIPFVGQANSRHWIDSIDRLLALAPKVIVPGHGPHTERPIEALQFTRGYLEFLRQAMGQAARELEPFEDAYRRTDWSRYQKMPMFEHANRMNAYNTYLLMEQE